MAATVKRCCGINKTDGKSGDRKGKQCEITSRLTQASVDGKYYCIRHIPKTDPKAIRHAQYLEETSADKKAERKARREAKKRGLPYEGIKMAPNYAEWKLLKQMQELSVSTPRGSGFSGASWSPSPSPSPRAWTPSPSPSPSASPMSNNGSFSLFSSQPFSSSMAISSSSLSLSSSSSSSSSSSTPSWVSQWSSSSPSHTSSSSSSSSSVVPSPSHTHSSSSSYISPVLLQAPQSMLHTHSAFRPIGSSLFSPVSPSPSQSSVLPTMKAVHVNPAVPVKPVTSTMPTPSSVAPPMPSTRPPMTPTSTVKDEVKRSSTPTVVNIKCRLNECGGVCFPGTALCKMHLAMVISDPALFGAVVGHTAAVC